MSSGLSVTAPISEQECDGEGIEDNLPSTFTVTDEDKSRISVLASCCTRFRSQCKRFVSWTSRVLFSRTWPSIVILLLVLVHCVLHLLLAILVYPPTVDLNMKSFQTPQGEASTNFDTLRVLFSDISNSKRASRRRREADTSSPNPSSAPDCKEAGSGYVIQNHLYLDLVFMAPTGSQTKNIFTKERLRDIHKLEIAIFNSSQYQAFCPKNYGKCLPLNSLLTYFYPSIGKYNKVVFDGQGDRLFDINTTMADILTHTESYWYVDREFGPDNPQSAILRTQVQVGLPLKGYCNSKDRKDEQLAKAKTYILSLVSFIKSSFAENVKVLYGGPVVMKYEVEEAVNHDAKLAGISGSLILILLFIMSGFSLSATLMGITTILSSFPLAFFVYRIIFKVETVGALNVVSLFVIMGIGIDDVFVFLNTFKQTSGMESIPLAHERLAFTIIHAGKSTFFTSLTTAVAFYANTLTSIPAVWQFGLFMGTVVLVCFVQVLVVMPPFLLLWEKYFSRMERCCKLPLMKCVSCITKIGRGKYCSKSSHDSIGNDTTRSSLLHPGNDEESDDEPMLQIGDATTQNDCEILRIEEEQRSSAVVTNEEMSTSELLNKRSKDSGSGDAEIENTLQTSINSKSQSPKSLTVLLKFVVRPLLAIRWLSLVILTLLTVAGIVCTPFISKSSGMLQMFANGTNLQNLFDLIGILADAGDIPCSKCSGYWMDHSPDTFIGGVSPAQMPYNLHCCYDNYKSCQNQAVPKPDYGGNTIVHLVFGVKGFQRSYSPLRVLPKGTELGTIVYDDHFSDAMRIQFDFIYRKYHYPSHIVNALCRICRRAQTPERGLVLPNGANCFPRDMWQRLLSAEPTIELEECVRLLEEMKVISTAITPLMYTQELSYTTWEVKAYVMPFKSTADPSKSVSDNKVLYQKWNTFIQEELAYIDEHRDIFKDSHESLLYTFHTSDYWVIMDLELEAMKGALSSILLSIGLCFLIMLVLFGNWRSTLTLYLLVSGIIFNVLLCFKILGWSIGVVESICLSILVGNSLDYCIHLVQSYNALDPEQLEFVERNGVKGSLRKRKTVAALTFISPSIISSSLTTLLATLPLLAGSLHMLIRFGQIILLTSGISIIFTLFGGAGILSLIAAKQPSSYCCPPEIATWIYKKYKTTRKCDTIQHHHDQPHA